MTLSMLEKQEKEALMAGGERSDLRKRVKDKVRHCILSCGLVRMQSHLNL